MKRSFLPPKTAANISWLFALLVFLELLLTAYLIADRRIPAGTDGFLYFILQYFFLNGAVTAGEIPQWIPYVTHGTITTWWYGLQAGFVQNILVVIGPLLKNADFLTLFYLSILFDRIILLTGTWLLAKRYFTNAYTIFFVCLTVLGSSVWYLQPSINLHFFYALPLIIYFLHTYFETGRWYCLLFAGFLYIAQILGNTPYLTPPSSFMIFVYFILYYIIEPKLFIQDCKNIKLNKVTMISSMLIAVFTLVVFTLINFSADQLVNRTPGRNPDGTTNIFIYLIYGQNTDLTKWGELITGSSPAFDYTLFIGILPLLSILIGLICYRSRQKFIFLALAIIFLLFSMGTPLAVFLYHFWPLMKYFRHLSLLSPIIKIALCFLAGFGLEVLINARKSPNLPDQLRKTIFLCLILLAAVTAFTLSLAFSPDNGASFINDLVNSDHGLPKLFITEPRSYQRLLTASTFSALLMIILTLYILSFRKRLPSLILVLLLSFHAVVIGEYHFSELYRRTTRILPQNEQVIRFTSIPFRSHRTLSLLPDQRTVFLDQFPIGLFCSPTDAFIFEDEFDNSFRSDYWLKPFDDYYVNLLRQDQNLHPEKVKQTDPTARQEFPRQPWALKLSGLTEEKIQFFSHAYSVNPLSRLGTIMRDSHYNGDILFISHGYAGMADWPEAGNLEENQRLAFPYEIKNFSANHLSLNVHVDGEHPVWMLYSDMYHPLWRAKINGIDTPVFKADLAYKAIQLPPGESTVEFNFGSRLIVLLQIMAGVVSLWIVGQTLLLAWELLRST